MNEEFDTAPFTAEQIGDLYRICPNHLKRMSKDLICVILAGFIQQVREAKDEFSHAGAVSPASIVPIQECLPFDELHSLLRDFRVTAAFTSNRLIMEKYKRVKPTDGFVYVAKFDDGHVKIGSTLYPKRRLKQVSCGNQAKLIDSWVSKPSASYVKIEKAAHEYFKHSRAGGEFFIEDMQTAVNWISGQIS